MFLTLKLFREDLRAIFRNEPNRIIGHLGGKADKTAAVLRVIVQVGVSIAILVFCLPILSSPTQSDNSKEVAAGLIGTVVGYWLR